MNIICKMWISFLDHTFLPMHSSGQGMDQSPVINALCSTAYNNIIRAYTLLKNGLYCIQSKEVP